MRKMSSITLKVIAGFFFYIFSFLGFINGPQTGEKLIIMMVFLVPALAALCGGLGLSGFSNWKNDTGIVLLCASGSTAFLVFTAACFVMTPEFRQMLHPGSLTLFSDYPAGGGIIFGFAALGWMLIKADKKSVKRIEIGDSRC